MFSEAQNLAIVRTELDTVFFQTFGYNGAGNSMATANTGELFREIPIDNLAHIGEVGANVGLWNSIGESQTVPEATPKVTNKFITNVLDFAKGVPLSKNMFDDNMHGVWSDIVRKFALKARLTQDQNAFKLFRGAFTSQLTPDGVSIVNAAHPLIAGGTTSNQISGPLNVPNLNTGFVSLAQQVDQTNVIIGGQAHILLVAPQNLQNAVQLTDSVLISDSANNAVNFYRSALGLIVMSSPYMGAIAGGSDTAWFLLTQDHAVRRVVRQGVETAMTPWQYSTNRTYYYQGNFREEVACYDYAGLVGSLGT